jgi:uncharacterized phiE125 gp8 family phage protein
VRLVVADPTDPVITWEDADAHLRLDGDTSQQAEVEAMIEAVIAHLDGAQGWLGRNLSQRQVDLFTHSFGDCGSLCLPLGPVNEVVLVEYRDLTTGAWEQLDPTSFELAGDILEPITDRYWPIHASHRLENVHVRYTAGFGQLPKPIRSALLLMLADLYENRETTVDARASAAVEVPMSTTVTSLLTPFRLWC